MTSVVSVAVRNSAGGSLSGNLDPVCDELGLIHVMQQGSSFDGRRPRLLQLAAFLAGVVLVLSACADDSSTPGADGGGDAAGYPEEKITFVVPFSAGGPTDTVTRLIAEPMSAELGQQIVVQNVEGAGGTVAAGEVAAATAAAAAAAACDERQGSGGEAGTQAEAADAPARARACNVPVRMVLSHGIGPLHNRQQLRNSGTLPLAVTSVILSDGGRCDHGAPLPGPARSRR